MVEKIGFPHFLPLNFFCFQFIPPKCILCKWICANFISLLLFTCCELIPIAASLKDGSQGCPLTPPLPKSQPSSDLAWQIHCPDQ